MASQIASACWYIWKSICECIFNNKSPDFTGIARAVEDHVKDFSAWSTAQKTLQFFHSNKPKLDTCISTMLATGEAI